MKALIFILKKSGQFFLTTAVLIVIVFFVARLAPGDPLLSYFGDSLERMTPSQQHEAMERFKLNEPLHSQFAAWVNAAVKGDFGISFKYKQSALAVVGSAIPGTLMLTTSCFVLIFFFAALLSIFCVFNEGKAADKIICRVGVTLNSIPEFFTALLLILIFCVAFSVFPASGAYAIGQRANPLSWVVHLILPVTVIVLTHTWYIAYMMRNKLSDELRKEYALMYRAKGLPDLRIYLHCFKNILPATISMMAVFLPHLLGGAYVIEMVFSYPGLGKLGFDSAKYHDYNMLMLISMITGGVVIFFNMAAQSINEWLDPRTKREGGA